MTAPRDLIEALRPRQWVKNVLVFTAPLAAGAFTELRTWLVSIAAFAIFSLASSLVYLVNDSLDVEEDRAHPVKRNRPIASGRVSIRAAMIGAVVLGALALAGAYLLAGWPMIAVIGTYIVLQLAYCVWLKHMPVIDLAVVSSGFLLRAMAGGVAAGVALSPWFLLVACFGSLFMVAGKRYSEIRLVGEGKASTRRSLQSYSASYLRFVWSVAATSAVVFYALWVLSLDRDLMLLPQLSIAAFVLAILRYAVDVDQGVAGEPETVVLRDRTLQILGVAWALLFGASALLG